MTTPIYSLSILSIYSQSQKISFPLRVGESYDRNYLLCIHLLKGTQNVKVGNIIKKHLELFQVKTINRNLIITRTPFLKIGDRVSQNRLKGGLKIYLERG